MRFFEHGVTLHLFASLLLLLLLLLLQEFEDYVFVFRIPIFFSSWKLFQMIFAVSAQLLLHPLHFLAFDA